MEIGDSGLGPILFPSMWMGIFCAWNNCAWAGPRYIPSFGTSIKETYVN